MTTPDSLFEQLSTRQGKSLPPVDKWNPDNVGHSRMRIDADGRWYYQDSEIQRPEMVKLFSTVLRRDGDTYCLVTPAEKLEIEIEDAPFVAVDLETRGEGRAQEVVFATNVDDLIVADADHPITVEGEPDAPKPYLHVRAGLHALISRPLYYRMIEMAVERPEAASDGARVVGIWSRENFFELGRYTD